LPSGNGELAVDLGCGYGRLTPILMEKGWRAIGIEPSLELLKYAREHYPGPGYCQGALPELPFRENSVSLLLLQNVLRSLKILDKLDVIHGVGRYLAQGGMLFLTENIRAGHPGYLPEMRIIQMMKQEGMILVKKIPIRAARWWMIYPIRYGLIPKKYFDAIAEWELARMEKRTGAPRFQYWNVLYIFEKRTL
jgi:SAM-dependent methyltransferase